MQTSTPVGSPAWKVLASKDALLSIENTDEDLEAELKNRRLEAINKSCEQRRKSVAPLLAAGLNAAQLAEHCRDCIKLSTENKINSKNAFSFLLIDFMAAMAKKKDSELSKNFQVASCTLDASVKIYGYRVDAVHTDAMKIAGGFFKKGVQEVLDGEDNDGNQSDQENVDPKLKPKKKRKKLTLVAPHTLNTRSESEALLDCQPKPNFLSGNANNNLLLKKIPKYNDGCLLMVESDVTCWPHGVDKSSIPQFEGGSCFEAFGELMSLFCEIRPSSEDRLCSAISSLQFGEDVADQSASDLELTQTSNFEFDPNVEVAHASYDGNLDCEVGPQRLVVPAGGYDSGDDIERPVAMQPQRQTAATISDMKRRLSSQAMEYSMYDEKLLKAWAGPTYWKVRPASREACENKENKDQGSKRTRKGKLKEPQGLFDAPRQLLESHLKPSERTILTKATVSSWKSFAFTLTEDYKYTVKQLFTPFHLPLIVVEPRQLQEAVEESLEDEGACMSPRGEEMDYCSSLIMPNEEEIQPDTEPNDLNKSAPEVQVWSADNMVAMPNKVQKISMIGFKRKNHVDIRHLKKCIWNILTDGGEEKKDGCQVTKAIGFCDLLRSGSTKLPKALANCVSAPLMFNALLHLTNERSLILKQLDKKEDFSIMQ